MSNESPSWLLPESVAMRLANEHRVSCGAVQSIAKAVYKQQAAERDRLLSMPNLMHACDHLGVPSDGTHCDILRRALYRA